MLWLAYGKMVSPQMSVNFSGDCGYSGGFTSVQQVPGESVVWDSGANWIAMPGITVTLVQKNTLIEVYYSYVTIVG